VAVTVFVVVSITDTVLAIKLGT